MSKIFPWDSIQEPSTEYNVRRIPKSDFLLWGKDAHGQLLLIVELEGTQQSVFKRERISIQGIESDLTSDPGIKSQQRLVLTLTNAADKHFYLAICDDLIFTLDGIIKSESRVKLLFKRLKRWKAFLASANNRILTQSEITGLYAELLFLEELLQKDITEREAIETWVGTDKIHQDFMFGNSAIEVKALLSKDRSSVRISSENQLEAVCDNLFLRIYRLSIETQEGLSLNDLAYSILSNLLDYEAKGILQNKLLSVKYVHLPEYSLHNYLVTAENTYCIQDGFPRLIRSKIPNGIVNIRYDIQLEQIKQYQCDSGEVWKDLQ